MGSLNQVMKQQNFFFDNLLFICCTIVLKTVLKIYCFALLFVCIYNLNFFYKFKCCLTKKTTDTPSLTFVTTTVTTIFVFDNEHKERRQVVECLTKKSLKI